jgi:hypothetical protein
LIVDKNQKKGNNLDTEEYEIDILSVEKSPLKNEILLEMILKKDQNTVLESEPQQAVNENQDFKTLEIP